MAGAPITLLLILIIIGTSFWGFNNRSAFQGYGLSAWRVIKHKEWYRLITHAFLHGDPNHLIFNLFTFFFFATQIEVFFKALFGGAGWIWFLGLFFSGILVATVPDLLYQAKNKNFLSIGASGGVATLVFASIGIDALSPICLYGVLCMPGGVWGIAYLAYSFYQDTRPNQTSNVNFKAHIAGAIWGFVAIWLIRLLLF